MDSHDSILTNNLPAPSKLTELSRCNSKGNWRNNRCKCYKKGFASTGMCKCKDWINNEYVKRK